MKRILCILVLLTVALLWVAPQAHAVLVNFTLGFDEEAALTIDSTLICSDPPGGGWYSCGGSYDMVPGTWYGISINYKNLIGSNGLGLWWDQPDYDDGVWTGGIVPKINLRTPDGAGGYISGLHADYYDTAGNFLFAVDGEGPIAHGNADGINTFYENQKPVLWQGFNFWGKFEEQLTGQIRIGEPIPEPATMFLLGSGLIGLAGFRRKKK